MTATAPKTRSTTPGDADTAIGNPARGWWRPLRQRPALLAIGAYALLGVYVCGAYWVDVTHRVSEYLPQDHTWFEWLFAHGAYSVRHLNNPLFSTRQNAPMGVNMMANTSMLGVTIPLAPLTMAFGPQVVYSVYLGGALAGTASTSYWILSRHLRLTRAAAFVGGLVVGFAPGVIHHASGQINFASNYLLPLIVAQVMRLGDSTRWRRDGVILSLLVTYQIFINEEMLMMTALACGVAVVAYAVQRRSQARRRLRPFLGSLALTAMITSLLTAYPLWFQFFGPQSYRGLNHGVFHNWGEDLASYVTFSRDSYFGSMAFEKSIGGLEQNSWFGLPMLVLTLVVTVALWRRAMPVRIAAIVALFFAVLANGPAVRLTGEDTGVPGVWAAIPDDLPVVEMVIPTRLALVIAGSVGITVAYGWDAVLRLLRARATDRRRRTRGYVLAALALLAMVPMVPRPLAAMEASAVPHFITSGAWERYVPAGQTLIPVPVPNDRRNDGLVTMRWSVLAGQEFPVPAGYFVGPDEDGQGIFGPPQRPTARLFQVVGQTGTPRGVTGEMRRNAREDVRFWKGAVVVLGPHPHEIGLLRLLTDLFGPGQRVDDVWLWDVRDL